MKHLFVPYEIALQLKEKGFDESCVAFYEESGNLSIGFNWLNGGGKNSNLESCTAPLYQQVIDWFREEHDFFIFIDTTHNFDSYTGTMCTKENNSLFQRTVERKNYYEALNDIIKKALKLI